MMNNNITTAEIVERGYGCLFEHLGTIETERFISYILSERFDYTKWRREYFGKASVEELTSVPSMNQTAAQNVCNFFKTIDEF